MTVRHRRNTQLEDDGRFHIRDVIGPDEYHEHVDDNAYTNVLAQWNLDRGLEVATLLQARWPSEWQALVARLELDVVELTSWRDISRRMLTGFDPATSLIEQFAGYFDLEDIDLTQFNGRTVPMDVVLGRERTQASQVIKQADVVMLLAMLSEHYDRRVLETNFRYYEPRCGHGSSLSRAMHAIVAARLGDVDLAARYFRETGATDLEDTTAGAAGGVRIAALGGLWQTAVFGFGGVRFTADGLHVDPCLPDSWQSLAFRLEWRGSRVHIRLQHEHCLTATLQSGGPLRVHAGGRSHTLQLGKPWQTCWTAPKPRLGFGPAA